MNLSEKTKTLVVFLFCLIAVALIDILTEKFLNPEGTVQYISFVLVPQLVAVVAILRSTRNW